MPDDIKKQTITVMLAILSTLAEEKHDVPLPASSIYLACSMDFDLYQRATQSLANAGMIELTPSTILLTPKGRRVGETMNKQLGDKP